MDGDPDSERNGAAEAPAAGGGGPRAQGAPAPPGPRESGAPLAQGTPNAQAGAAGQRGQGAPGGATNGAQRRKPLNPRVRFGLMIAGGVVVLLGVVFGVIWLVHWRFIVTTDDAYLRADAVTVAPRVSGYIDQIYVKENQHVVAGQKLLHIDKQTYQDTLSQQSASLQARIADVDAADSQIRQQSDVIAQNRAQADSAHAKAQFARQQAVRYRSLSDQGADTAEKSAQYANESTQASAAEAAAVATLRASESQLGVLKSQREQAQAQLESAKAAVSSAQQNLDDTVIRASVEGTVGDDSARVGQYVQPGTRLMSVVPLQSVYLVANFKETQIKQMRIGQAATVKVDAINGAQIDARVESFAPGTGAEFALLPPENATGNFIKIVQRVPVRLKLMPPREIADRLLPGLSATVSVDVRRERRDRAERHEDPNEMSAPDVPASGGPPPQGGGTAGAAGRGSDDDPNGGRGGGPGAASGQSGGSGDGANAGAAHAP